MIFAEMEILIKYFTDFTEKQLHQFAALKDLYTGMESKDKCDLKKRS